ncbi:flagellar motor switch protein FliN [Symbiobacterium terraclitae]|uniref:flagellar motor switch protein FliN n=1 Tax=Symbiobacterium terraclitae TaxID=557451 RepID=UPI0035B56840
MSNKLSQSEIDALVASLLANDSASQAKPPGQGVEAPKQDAATEGQQPAAPGPAEYESAVDLGPVTQAELDAAAAAARAARRGGPQAGGGAAGAAPAATAAPIAAAASTAAAGPAAAAGSGAGAARSTGVSAAGAGAGASGSHAAAGPAPVVRRLPAGLRDALLDIELTLSVELGRTRLPLGDILEMGPGSVITLNRMANEPLDVRVSQLPIMKAEVIAIGENYGIRIVETKLETDKAS